MFKIQNNRLHYGGISFPLPNGLYLNTDMEVAHENGLELRPQDKSFRIIITFIEYEETTEEYIKGVKQNQIQADWFIYGDNHPHLKPIEKIKLNELDGFAYLYKDNVESHFDSVCGNIHLSICIETKCNKEVLARQDVQDFFKGIRIER